MKALRIIDMTETLVLTIKRDDGNDLSETTARVHAEDHLAKINLLGGWGGHWYFSDTERTNYDTVRVTFTP